MSNLKPEAVNVGSSGRLDRALFLAALLLVITAFFHRTPVVDALTLEAVPDAGLKFTLPYLAFAPILGILDHLSLLTDRQHLFVLLTAGALFLAWRWARGLSKARRESRIRHELAVAGAMFVLWVGFYAFGVLGTRPMAALEAYDPDLVIVDFHSHTDASHDGRPGFDVRDRRTWHRGAGYDLVYLTDHANLDGVHVATTDNPLLAGQGTSLLPGRETRFENQHVLVLGTQDPSQTDLGEEVWPTLIQTIPNDLSRVPTRSPDGTGGVHAIELVDADPRGLRQSVEEREILLSVADSLGLALVAGSNHHGWGRAAAAWNLVRVPGWQESTPEQVGARIEAEVRNGSDSVTRVVERRRLAARGREALVMEALILPRLSWHVLTSLTLLERVAWLAWLALALALCRPGAPLSGLDRSTAMPLEPARSANVGGAGHQLPS